MMCGKGCKRYQGEEAITIVLLLTRESGNGRIKMSGIKVSERLKSYCNISPNPESKGRIKGSEHLINEREACHGKRDLRNHEKATALALHSESRGQST